MKTIMYVFTALLLLVMAPKAFPGEAVRHGAFYTAALVHKGPDAGRAVEYGHAAASVSAEETMSCVEVSGTPVTTFAHKGPDAGRFVTIGKEYREKLVPMKDMTCEKQTSDGRESYVCTVNSKVYRCTVRHQAP